MAHHAHWTAPMAAWVLINRIWYKSASAQFGVSDCGAVSVAWREGKLDTVIGQHRAYWVGHSFDQENHPGAQASVLQSMRRELPAAKSLMRIV